MSRAHDVLRIVRDVYGGSGPLALHAPVFAGNEMAYVRATIESTVVSSVGAYVDRFEQMLSEFTGARYVIATANGTTALHMALLLASVPFSGAAGTTKSDAGSVRRRTYRRTSRTRAIGGSSSRLK